MGEEKKTRRRRDSREEDAGRKPSLLAKSPSPHRRHVGIHGTHSRCNTHDLSASPTVLGRKSLSDWRVIAILLGLTGILREKIQKKLFSFDEFLFHHDLFVLTFPVLVKHS